MATIAKYDFPSSDADDKASSTANREIGSDSASSWSSSSRVEISDSCRDPAKAAQIMLAYGGKPA